MIFKQTEINVLEIYPIQKKNKYTIQYIFKFITLVFYLCFRREYSEFKILYFINNHKKLLKIFIQDKLYSRKVL